MTHLFIDAGNTWLKWRVRTVDGQVLDGAGRQDAPGLFDGVVLSDVSAISISAVIADEARHRLSAELASQCGLAPDFYWTRPAECGVSCAYDEPDSMGADRWHALIGARMACESPLMVIDAGSALTIDILDGRGVHQGGYILPGHRLMCESLEDKTARVTFGKTLSLDASPGTSTDACVRNGLSWLWSSLIDRIELMRTTYGVGAVFVTGGDAESLVKLGLVAELRPNLVIDGLEAVVSEAGKR